MYVGFNYIYIAMFSAVAGTQPDDTDSPLCQLTPASQRKRDGLAPAPQIGKGWDRPDTGKRKGMGSPRHHRAERDGIAPAPQSGEGWDRPDTANRRRMVSPRLRIAERDGIVPTP